MANTNLFTPPYSDAITSITIEGADRVRGTTQISRTGRDLHVASDRGALVDISNQFVVFQLNSEASGPALLESSLVDPKLEGSPDNPDVLVALELLSLHLGRNERVEPGTRATLRINFGKDESSTDRRFDTAFWSIAAGLNLYDEVQGKTPNNKDFKCDLHKAFGNRPIEIPGGLGRLSFEIVKHREPAWWKRIFSFMQSGTGSALISVLGFPAVTKSAVDALDELLSRLTDQEPEPLFKSLPMRLALSTYARDEFTGGSKRVRIGSLSRGFCVLARGRDFAQLNSADVAFFSTYGRLFPRGASDADLVSGELADPLEDVTYAVFRIGTKAAKLDPTFNFT